MLLYALDFLMYLSAVARAVYQLVREDRCSPPVQFYSRNSSDENLRFLYSTGVITLEATLACSLVAAVLLDLDKRFLIELGVEELEIRTGVKECTCRIEFPLGTQLPPAGRSPSPSNDCTCKCYSC
eukprot:sb/3475564/